MLDVARSLSAKMVRANRFTNAQSFAALGWMVTIRREANSLGGGERLAPDELECLQCAWRNDVG